MSSGSSVDCLDQHGSSRQQIVISDSPKLLLSSQELLLSSQERLNSSQSLTVLVDSKEISNPQVCIILIPQYMKVRSGWSSST